MKNLRREVSEKLVARGFRRNDRAHFLMLDEQFSFAIDTGPLGKRADIAPFVGIRHEGVEHLLSELLELPDDPWSGTVGANVGYVLGLGYQWWEPPADADVVLSAIDEALERLRPFLSLAKLPGVWELTDVKDPAWRYREIAIMLLEGKPVDDRLESARAEFCAQRDAICDQFEQFERNVRAYQKQPRGGGVAAPGHKPDSAEKR